jgi:hypothetical protein
LLTLISQITVLRRLRLFLEGNQVMWNGRMTVLLVEDDEVDATAVMRSFRNLKIDHAVVLAHDGVKALQRLRGETVTKDCPRRLLYCSI